MSKPPEEEPFGIATGLQLPTDAAQERARPIFERLLAATRSRPTRAPLPMQFGGGRRYDVALSLVVGLPGVEAAEGERSAVEAADAAAEPEEITQSHVLVPWADEVTHVMHLDDPPDEDAGSELLLPHPPAGAPTVRRSVRAPSPAAQPAMPVSGTEDTAMMWTDKDGNRSFQITFNDEVFRSLTCTITLGGGKVVATFTASDDNTRRLLEAEAGRLRLMLESRGLRVQEVRVVKG